WREAADTGADLLWRLPSTVKLPVDQQLPDGSYLSRLMTNVEQQRVRRDLARGVETPAQGIVVRVVEYEITNRDADPAGPIRLITTVVDSEQVSAVELAATYHQRWEFESSLAEIETRQRGRARLLRSQSPQMVRQEIWGLLTTHCAIRELMHHAAADIAEDIGSLRLSFIRSLRVVRRSVTGQAGFSP
ncbi:transposase, partial [Nocardia seriolae]|uniref:transposase n=1 Tax=Nocardia seriolae TaxID=37332 RepID=UPI0012BC9BD3